MSTGLIITLAIVVILVVVVVGLASMLASNYIKVPPNEAAVFVGKNSKQIIRGGAKFRIPIIHDVSYLNLTPHDLEVYSDGALDVNNVPIQVQSKALIKIGSDTEMLETAADRFLGVPRTEIDSQLRDIMQGSLRGIIANMTVEDLNSNREQLRERVANQAEGELEAIGMELDNVTILKIDDENGYLRSLGEEQLAQKKKDAAIAVADADRETRERTAEARLLGRQAEALSDTEIAKAEQARDLERARIKQEVDAANAIAEEAGNKARATAHGDVLVEEARARTRKEEAQAEAEERRAVTMERTLQADVVAVADADAQAAVLRAEADKKAEILAAEASKQREVAEAEAEAAERRLAGNAEAEARTAVAAAEKAELLAQAEGKSAMLTAEAEGARALGLAEAEGQAAMSEALNAMDEDAIMAQIIPVLAEQMPAMAKAIADGIGNVDSIVMYDGGGTDGSGSGMMDRLMGRIPAGSHMVGDAIKNMTGVDLSKFVGERFGSRKDDGDIIDVDVVINEDEGDDARDERIVDTTLNDNEGSFEPVG